MKPIEMLKRGIAEGDERALVLMCGIPNAGKTTMVEEFVKDRDDIAVISRDSILMEYGKEKYGVKTYSEVWSKLTNKDQQTINKLLNNKIKRVQAQKKHVIVDMTMLTIMSRKSMIENFGHNYKVACVALVASWPVIISRNERRAALTGKSIPIPVLQDMWMRYKIPIEGENPRIEQVEVYITDRETAQAKII